MRLTTVILIASLMQVSAATFGQRVTLNQRNIPLESALKEIRRQSGFDFYYDGKAIPKTQKVDVSITNVTVAEALKHILNGLKLNYQIDGKTVVIKTNEPSVMDNVVNLFNAVDLSGTVKDEKGNPIPGVVITVKGTTIRTVTDNQGRFKLKVNNVSDILVFSYIGMQTREVNMGGNTQLDIIMKENIQNLSETVVVGYGTQKRQNLTGAISVIDSKMLTNRPVTNAIAALQGTAPGLTVTRGSGQPGKEGYGIQIRGLSSVNGNSPLYIIDGAPGTLANLNPDDIESISVLKDAAAAAIYGARAAAGVILITTKAGISGKTKIQYGSIIGLQRPTRLPERLHSWEEAEMANQAQSNAGLTLLWTDEQLQWMRDPDINYKINPSNPSVWDFYYDIDPIKEELKDISPSQQHNLSLSGGTDKNRYLLSLAYFNQEGIFKHSSTDKTNRFNARFNYSTRFSNKLSADIRLSYVKTRVLSPNRGTDGNNSLLYDIYRLRTLYPTYLPESDNTKYATISGDNVGALLREGGNTIATNHYFEPVFTLKADSLVKGLTLRAIYAPSLLTNNTTAISRTIPLYNRLAINNYMNNPNAYTDAYLLQSTNNAQLLADYDLKLGDRHIFHVLGGTAFEDYNYRRTTANARALVSNDLFTLGLGDPAQATNTQDIQTWALMSYFGRFNYNFDERFLFEFNMRYDGSSKLAPENRWQLFPSVSAAWRLNNENWFKNALPFFEEFKIRGSWGQLGNSNGVIGNYDYIGLIDKGPVYPFNNQINNSLYQNNLASPVKTWETVESSNIGLNIGMFKNRLTFSGDYYTKLNKNMLAPLQVSSTIGVTPSTYNIAKLKTWGWELSLGWQESIGSNLRYWVNGNLADDQNKILEYNGQSTIASGINTIIEGMPYNSIYGYRANGYFNTAQEVAASAFQNSRTGPGDIRYIDINGDNVISAGLGRVSDHGDLEYLGSTQPRLVFGLNGGFEWKGLDFSFFLQGVGKRNVLLNSHVIVPFTASYRMPWRIHQDYWTPENTDARFPRLYANDTQNLSNSTHWLANSAYIRLKNLQVGYTLPSSWTRKLKLEKVRVYFTGQDLWESTKMWYPYYDPESPYSADYIYPFYRTYSFGLNVNF